MRLRHLYHRVGNSTGFCTFYGITELPVLTSYCERPDGILTKVIGETAAPIFQIGHGCFSAVPHIGQCLIQAGVADWLLAVNPRTKGLENRFFFLETYLFPFFIIRSALTGNAAFQSCQAVAVMHSLYCRLVVIQLLSFRDRIYKVWADMCPARAPFDTGYLVIPLITIGFQISLKAVQKKSAALSPLLVGVYPYSRMTGRPSSLVRYSHMKDWLSTLRPSSFRTWTWVSSAMRNSLSRSWR